MAIVDRSRLLVIATFIVVAAAVGLFHYQSRHQPSEGNLDGVADSPTENATESVRRQRTLPTQAVPTTAPPVSLPGESANDLTTSSPSTDRLVVRVVEEGTKTPISAVLVRVFRPKERWTAGPTAEAKTDDRGRAVLFGVEDGQWAFEVVSKEWGARRGFIDPIQSLGKRRFWIDQPKNGKERSVTIPVIRRFSVRGRVVDEAGVPVVDAVMTLREMTPMGRADHRQIVEPTTTDSAGRFEFDDTVYSESAAILAVADAIVHDHPGLLIAPMPSETLSDVQVVVRRFRPREVTIYFRSPLPMALGGIEVFAWNPKPVPKSPRPALTDAFGKAVFTLDEGTNYDISFRPEQLPAELLPPGGDAMLVKPRRVNPAEQTEVVIDLVRAYQLKVRVLLHDGTPVVGGRLNFAPAGTFEVIHGVTATDVEGRLSRKVPSTGAYDIVRAWAEIEVQDKNGKKDKVRVEPTEIDPFTVTVDDLGTETTIRVR